MKWNPGFSLSQRKGSDMKQKFHGTVLVHDGIVLVHDLHLGKFMIVLGKLRGSLSNKVIAGNIASLLIKYSL